MVRRFAKQAAIIGLMASAAHVPVAHAQLNTQHIKGTVGLKSGTQPPPHWYGILPLLVVYKTDTVKDRDGDRLPIDADLTSTAFGAGVARVTSKKFLGANYGFQILFPVGFNNRIQGTELEADPGAGLTDSVVQPISLGWHFKRADAIAGYSIFVPTDFGGIHHAFPNRR